MAICFIIFQSTLPRGERHLYCFQDQTLNKFQSTLPRGERHVSQVETQKRETTFQSTLPRGERHDNVFQLLLKFQFQSTLPRGERLLIIFTISFLLYFNPRSREGSDQTEEYCKLPNKLISIHAPARGATCGVYRIVLYHLAFQSTLPRGERPQIHTNN